MHNSDVEERNNNDRRQKLQRKKATGKNQRKIGQWVNWTMRKFGTEKRQHLCNRGKNGKDKFGQCKNGRRYIRPQIVQQPCRES